eukprot:CAMPEP_0117670874 /NCGR_PEP_ID=MMETSP0804-20121206/13014_1 /TAXON_ID=1074897 /ORGANISM="Tetraselmis astigmatica, Strain CCMP880" /LENGTH=69 /DNA_ID=CAMNT_0005479259 /DNA_START=338 /DNA_END=544 /DNA_ORIENTATION=+
MTYPRIRCSQAGSWAILEMISTDTSVCLGCSAWGAGQKEPSSSKNSPKAGANSPSRQSSSMAGCTSWRS